MGYLDNMYNFYSNEAYQIIAEESEIYMEQFREEMFNAALDQVKDQTSDLTHNEKESMRIGAQQQLQDLHEEIEEAWGAVIHKVATWSLIYRYSTYVILMPTIVLLFIGQILASQIYALVAVTIIFLLGIDQIRDPIIFFFSGLEKDSAKLEDLYELYGAVEATIKVVDTRGLSQIHRSRNYWVYSHHQKEKAP